MQTGSDPLIKFYYDANGKRTYFDYLGSAYYYLYNIQGDVIALTEVNNVGGSYVYQTVCEYRYDSWGNIENVTTNSAYTKKNPAVVAQVNPFRYRGYFYDTETKLYCLQTRYYNPEWCRFINADSIIQSKRLINNIFVYCGNNPIQRADYSGRDYDDLFNSVEEAVYDFASCYAQLAYSTASEYGTFIYEKEVEKTYITYSRNHDTGEMIKTTTKVKVKQYGYVKPNHGEPYTGQVSLPWNWWWLKKVVAQVHIHARVYSSQTQMDAELRFSDKDIKNSSKYVNYLILPNGDILKRDPNNLSSDRKDGAVLLMYDYDLMHPDY
jgi:RHS repeat-associated protein